MKQVLVSEELLLQAIDTIGYYARVCGEDDQDTPAKQTQKALRTVREQPAVEPDFWIACGTSDDGRLIPLPNYCSIHRGAIERRVLYDAKEEGFVGTASQRLSELGWDIRQACVLNTAPQAQQPAPVQGSTLPDITSRVVNDMCWKIVEELPNQLSSTNFNALKPAVYEALKLFITHQAAQPLLGTAPPPPPPKVKEQAKELTNEH